jgi:hypothetical protein
VRGAEKVRKKMKNRNKKHVKVCTAAAGSRRQVGPVELRYSLVELR